MRKADDLRDWLLRTVPDLASNPDKLKTYLSKGSLDFQPGTSLSFGYRYELDLVLENFTASLDTLFVPLIIWLSRNEPAAIDKNDGGPAFMVDVLDHNRSDIQITLPLREVVVVKADPDVEGGFLAEHPPVPESPSFSAVGRPTALLSRLFLAEFGENPFQAAPPLDE